MKKKSKKNKIWMKAINEFIILINFEISLN